MRASLAPAALLLAAASGCLADPAPAGEGGEGVFGVATLGPTCPVERDPPEPGCEDRAFEGDLVAVREDSGAVARAFRTSADGTFNVTLAPGDYAIRSPGTNGLPSCSATAPVRVDERRWTRVDVACDTGIRI